MASTVVRDLDYNGLPIPCDTDAPVYHNLEVVPPYDPPLPPPLSPLAPLLAPTLDGPLFDDVEFWQNPVLDYAKVNLSTQIALREQPTVDWKLSFRTQNPTKSLSRYYLVFI